MSRASSVPEITRGRMPVCSVTAWRNSPPFSASRIALVATATISSTRCDSASRAELRQHLQRRVHRLGRERAAVESAGAEADHLLLAIDDLEREIGADPHDDHVQRIGADVDGGDSHVNSVCWPHASSEPGRYNRRRASSIS